jgi:hypothetical protein
MATKATFSDLGAYVTWSVRENCTWSRAFTATQAGTAVNLTGFTVTAEVTASETSNTALKTFTATLTNAAAGQFKIVVTAANATLSPGRYWWSMQWNDGTNDVPLCSGPFVIAHWTL